MTVLFINCTPLVAHILNKEFPSGKIPENSFMGAYLRKVLQHKRNRFKKNNGNKFSVSYRIVLKEDTKRRYGRWLNESQCIDFNKFVSRTVRERLNMIIATYILFDPSFGRAAQHARLTCDIPEEVYSDCALQQDFNRWRQRNGGPRIYKKNVA